MPRKEAILRFHFRIPKREWDERNYTEEELIEMWHEFYFVKEYLGEVKKD